MDTNAPDSDLHISQFDLSALNNFLTINSGSPGFQVHAGFDFNLSFTYEDTGPNGPRLQLDPASNALLINVVANWSNPRQSNAFTGTLNNLLFVTGANPTDSAFVGNFAVGLSPDGSVQGVALTFGSQAILNTDLSLQFGQNTLPFNLSAHGHLHLAWNLEGTFDAFGGYRPIYLTDTPDSFGRITEAQFQGVTLDVNPLTLTGFVDNAVAKIRDFAQPFVPIASVLRTEIPGLGALGLHIRLANLVDGLGSVVDFIDRAGSLNDHVMIQHPTIEYGNLILTPPNSSGNLLAALLAGTAQPSADSGVVLPPGTPDVFSQANSATGDVFHKIEDALRFSDGNNRVSVGFPIVDLDPQDPGNPNPPRNTTLFQLLLGTDSSLLSLEAHFNINQAIPFPPIPIAFIVLQPHASVTFQLDLSIGYATSGLRKAGREPDAGRLTSDLLSGFFFNVSPGQGMGHTGLNFRATIGLDASAFAIAHVDGSLTANIGFTLPSDKDITGDPNASSTVLHLYPNLLDRIRDDPLCALGLQGEMVLQFSIRIGFDIPFGPTITLWEYAFPRITLLSFSARCGIGSGDQRIPAQIFIPLGPGDHDIRVHKFIAEDPTTPSQQITGIEWQDGGLVQRVPTARMIRHPDGSVTLLPWNPDHPDDRLETIVVTPTRDDQGNIIPTGNDTVVIAQDVIGDWHGDQVNALMIGGDDGDDDFEYYGHGQAVLIGGKKSNTLIGRHLEYGGGLPQEVYDRVQHGDYSDFPDWVARVSVPGPAQYSFKGIDPFTGPPGFTTLFTIAHPGENPLINARELQGGDGDDFLVGTAGADVLYGGSGTNTFNGLGGGDVVHGEYGQHNTFIESAMNNDLNPGGNPLVIDNNTDLIYGGHGTNLLQFRGYLHGEQTENITAQGLNSPILPGLLQITDPVPGFYAGKKVWAFGITQLAIEAGYGSVTLGDLTNTPVRQTAIKFDSRAGFFQPNQITIDATSQSQATLFQDPHSNPDHWTIAQDSRNNGWLELTSVNEGIISLQGLTTNSFGSWPDQVILDDTTRDRTSGATFEVQSLPAHTPDLTINLGPGLDFVNVPAMDTLPDGLLTVNGGSGPGVLVVSPSAQLSQTGYHFKWDVEPTKLGFSWPGHPESLFLYYSGLSEVIINRPDSVDISPLAMTLDGLPGQIILNPGVGSLGINDQNTTAFTTFDVTGSSVVRTSRAARPVTITFASAGSLYIDGAGGFFGSQFNLTTPFQEQSRGLLPISPFRITGHGAVDVVTVNDAATVPFSEGMDHTGTTWNVYRDHVARTYVVDSQQNTSEFKFDFYNIFSMTLIGSTQRDQQGNSVTNKFILSPDQQNLNSCTHKGKR
jgi:hypothetical protein